MGDIVLYVLVGLAVWGMVISLWNDRKEMKLMRKEMEQRQALAGHQTPSQYQDLHIQTRDLFLDTLTKIGCQYELREGEDNRVFFAYQGEHFFADTTNESLYVCIWDAYWEHVELYNVDDVARLRKAINTSNFNSSVTTVFTIDEAGNNMDVHSKSTIPFVSTMPDLEMYLRAELDNFFRAHQIVGSEMHNLREEEKSV